ncbi:MAG: 2Fe-2S iron-sulfur cluster binding domain-containing protein [Halobacteriovoraceae bacterium]|jgi:ferredoxin|nr:2Fe-2S iron-sulfur cluster binding domain-containing protein [Halobacteriovoraceae bacterium]MBT5094002.1 2Fe-2S iron-sulfur cluster binding domain-containing protein [Halobacteriovoraceae bacterium]
MSKVILLPSKEVLDIPEDKNLLEALREKGIYIRSGCGGFASCSDCKIKVTSGEDATTPPTFEEIQLLGTVFHITKERLACQTKVFGDVTIDISGHDQKRDEETRSNKSPRNFGKKTKVRKRDEVVEIEKERKEQRDAKDAEVDGDWTRHWEKDQKPDWDKRKKLDGGKRPRPFKDAEELSEAEKKDEADEAKPDNENKNESD